MLLTFASFPNLLRRAEEAAFHIANLWGDDRTLPKSQISKSSNLPLPNYSLNPLTCPDTEDLPQDPDSCKKHGTCELARGMTPTVSSASRLHYASSSYKTKVPSLTRTVPPRLGVRMPLVDPRVGSMITYLPITSRKQERRSKKGKSVLARTQPGAVCVPD